MAKLNGYAVASVAVGSVLVYAGVTGRSVLATIQAIVQGKAPKTAPITQQIGGATATTTNTNNFGLSGPNSAAQTPTSQSESAWISAFLSSIGAPQTAANVASMSDWIAHEGPYGTQGGNNPLNTTLQLAGSTSFAGLAVQNYPTAAEGMQATVDTLESGAYPDILRLLRAGQGLKSGAEANLSTWSGGGYTSV